MPTIEVKWKVGLTYQVASLQFPLQRLVAKIKFLLILTAKVVDLINSIGCCYKINKDKKEILGDPLEIESLRGNYCLPTKVDKVPDSAGYDDYSYYQLKGVKVAFSLEEGLLESFSSYYKRLEADLIAIVAVIGIEVDSIDCRGGKQSSSGIFPAVVALIYIGV